MSAMRISILLLCSSLLLCASTCKKTSAVQSSGFDSVRIVRSGGIAGINDRYLITRSYVARDTSRNYSGNYTFNYRLPQEKFEQVKVLLKGVPARMMNENEFTYGQQVPDGFIYDITAWKGKTTYHWNILTLEPDYVQPFTSQLNDAFNALRTPPVR